VTENLPTQTFLLACEQAPGGASAEQTFGAKRRALPGASRRMFAQRACSQANVFISLEILRMSVVPSCSSCTEK